jgi:hypothetical protein
MNYSVDSKPQNHKEPQNFEGWYCFAHFIGKIERLHIFDGNGIHFAAFRCRVSRLRSEELRRGKQVSGASRTPIPETFL